MKRLALVAAGAGVAVTPVLTTTAAAPAQAAAACGTHADPAPVVLSSIAADVTPGTARGYDPQTITIHADDPCGRACADGEPSSCSNTFGNLQARRTAGSGASCLHNRFLDFDAIRAETDGSRTYVDTVTWTASDSNEEPGSPQPLTNKCAGAYDTTTTIDSEHTDATSGEAVFRRSQPFAQSRAFYVRRPSHLTANAGPEPVRKGRTVSVTGRLTRADWDARNNAFAAYPDQTVLLQRRTLSGTFHTLKTVRTDRTGYLHTGVKALSGTRCFRFVFPKNATTQGRPSGEDCVLAR